MLKDIELLAVDEVFEPVIIYNEEFPNYMVSNYGRIYSLTHKKFIKGYINKRGYIDFDLYKCGKRKHIYGHRLVAFRFVKNENPDKQKIINHIDEKRINNFWKNLEWCNHSYNLTYGDAQARRIAKISKPVIQVDSDSNIVATYPSLSETSRQTHIPLVSLYRACTYGIPQRGYNWAYTGYREVIEN